MSPTQMTLSDPSHAAEQRKNLPSLAPDSVVSTILRIQTRLAIKARDDNRKMGGFPLGKNPVSSPSPSLPQSPSFLACSVPNCGSFLMLQRKAKTKFIWVIMP